MLEEGNSNMVGNSALEVGNVEYVDSVAPDLVPVALVGVIDCSYRMWSSRTMHNGWNIF